MDPSMEASMEAMESPLLTIAEAAEKIGRSHSTIRRLIKTIADSPAHPDRSGIEPSPKVVEAFKKKGETFTWMVREDVLMKHLQSAPKEEKKMSSDSSSTLKADIIDILRKELGIKNQQIEKQGEIITSLNERLREGNILMGSLQQRLAPPQTDSPSPTVVETPSMESSMDPFKRASKKKVMEAKEAVAKKTGVKISKEPQKRGVLSWLFR